MQRTDERERTADPEVGADDDASEGPTEGRRGLRSRIGGRLGRVFSVKTFALALAASLVAMFLGGSIPIVGVVGRFVGLFAVAFAVGLASSRRRYLEVGLAAALASGLGFVFGVLTSALLPVGLSVLSDYGVGLAGVGAGSGLLVALAGHYFGRDLRDGLTRNV
jgi:hypothetical protein